MAACIEKTVGAACTRGGAMQLLRNCPQPAAPTENRAESTANRRLQREQVRRP
jgi:hypothetical protein